MFKWSYSDIVKEINNKTNLSEEDITSKIDKKLEVLKDLISKEGAAHIVANELGVKLVQEYSEKKLKINGLMPGLNFINIDARIVSIYDVKSFKNEKREGKVSSMTIGDDTGIARLVLWDTKLIELVESEKLKENDVITIKNAYCKENLSGMELHLGSKGEILINPPNINIGNIKSTRSFNQKSIKELKENELAEINGTIVQLFEPKFYVACSECNKKAEMINGIYACKEHGNIVTKEVPILNFFLDDGTDNIRVVCFRELANKVLDNNFARIRTTPSEFDMIKNDILGKQIKINGKVNKNTMFDRLEFSAQDIQDLDPKQILKELRR